MSDSEYATPAEPPCGPMGLSEQVLRERMAALLHQAKQRSFRYHLASCRGQNSKQAEGLRGELRGMNEAIALLRHHFGDLLP